MGTEILTAEEQRRRNKSVGVQQCVPRGATFSGETFSEETFSEETLDKGAGQASAV